MVPELQPFMLHFGFDSRQKVKPKDEDAHIYSIVNGIEWRRSLVIPLTPMQ
jgi:hypothetical protein